MVAVDTETYSTDPADKKGALKALRCGLKGVSLSWQYKGRVWSHYWSFNPADMSKDEAAHRWKKFKREILKPLFNRKTVVLVFHNASFDLKVFYARGLWPKTPRISDTMIMDFLLDENRPHDLKTCARDHLGVEGALSHKATHELIKEIVKAAEKVAKVFAQGTWEAYRDFHKSILKLKEIPSKKMRGIILNLRERVLKKDVIARAYEEFGNKIISKAKKKAISLFHTYARKDALWTFLLHHHLLPRIQHEGFGAIYWHLYQSVLRQSIEMEITGIRVDLPKLKEIRKLLDKELTKLTKKIKKQFGKDFNPNSSVKVKHLLWVEKKLKAPPWLKKSDYGKDGLPGSGEEIIEWLVEQGHKFLKDILTYRKLGKTKSTYIDPLIYEAEMDPEGRIHTNFSIIKRTARWGSSMPNLQNIPRWATLQKYIPDIPSIRSCFIARKGYKLLVADYSQIDLRVMTHCTRDPGFWKSYRTWKCRACKKTGETKKAYHACPLCGEKEKGAGGKFELGEDIHQATAKATNLIERYGKKEGRYRAKHTNFGAMYLMGPNTLAQQIEIPVKEAKATLEAYHEAHPGVRAYANRMTKVVEQQGFFWMLNGQKRRFDGDLRKIDALKRRGTEESYKEANKKHYALTREIMNNSGQGGAAVILNTAMWIMWRNREFLKKNKTDLLLQVHDELVYEVPIKKAKKVKPWIREKMEQAGKLDVPVLADIAEGNSWESAK